MSFTRFALSAFGVAALVAAAQPAHAQFQGATCQTVGAAQIGDGGIPGGTEAKDVAYTFTGSVTDCQAWPGTPTGTEVCSRGVLAGATCSGNETRGLFAICKGDCLLEKEFPVLDESGEPVVDGSGNPVTELRPIDPECAGGTEATVIQGPLEGRCGGAVCGGTYYATGGYYALVFDQATIEDAGVQCDPSAPGAIQKAAFSGSVGYQLSY